MRTIEKVYRIDKSEISYFRFLLESYEGIAMMTTVEPKNGIVVLRIAPGCEHEVDTLIQGLKHEMLIEPVEGPCSHLT